MKEHLSISSKGQITLPAAMRQALGLDAPAIVTAELREGRIVLSPAMVVETEIWADTDVAAWDEADTFAPGERQALEAALAAPTRRGKGPGRGPGHGR
jgi:bifunctional DNA-binding transcriptional regulator/antitoxin component of YhaV-PrlF toxin-antitoxin module